MKTVTLNFIENFYSRNEELNEIRTQINEALRILLTTCKDETTILTCGNGGSASDAEHIVGELMKGFILKRPINDELKKVLLNSDNSSLNSESVLHLQMALSAVSLISQTALLTAYCNDESPDMVFAQQVLGYRKHAGCLIALSTSGNSKNVINAVSVANSLEIKTIGFTGKNESDLSRKCSVCIQVPAEETYLIQEYHIKIYHLLCAALELELYEV